MENQEHINTLLNQLTKQQQEITSKEEEIKALLQENKKLKQNIPQKEKIKNSSIYRVERKRLGSTYGFTMYDENLKKVRLEHFRTKAEAEAKKRKLLDLRDKKKLASYLSAQDLTFNDLYNAYQTNARVNNFALNTISSAESLYRNHLQFFANMKVHKITKLAAQQWAEEKRYSIGASAYNNCLKQLKAIWNNANKKDIISLSNPFNILEPINVKKEMIIRKKVLIETEECKNLINTAKSMFNDYTSAAIACSFYAGLREGEVLGLFWSDIDFKNNLITVQRQVQRITKKQLKELIKNNPKLTEQEVKLTYRLKTYNSKATIAVPKVLIDELRNYKEKLERFGQIHELCFTIDGTPLVAMDFIKNRFHKVLNAVYGNKKYMIFHDLRSSCATLLHKKGVPTKVIQKLLRHGKASTTENIYIDVDSTSDYVKNLLNNSFS